MVWRYILLGGSHGRWAESWHKNDRYWRGARALAEQCDSKWNFGGWIFSSWLLVSSCKVASCTRTKSQGPASVLQCCSSPGVPTASLCDGPETRWKQYAA